MIHTQNTNKKIQPVCPDILNLSYYDSYFALLVIFIFCLESELRGFVLSRYPQQGHQKLSTEFMFHMLDNAFVL